MGGFGIVRRSRADIYTQAMYEVTVERTFSAAHAIRICEVVEPVHGHNWLVKVSVCGHELDDDGLLCDFHTVEEMLAEICGRFHNGNLNAIPPFDRTNPTAELVAWHIAEELGRGLDGGDVWVSSVSVQEAVGCVATYRPGKPS